MSVTINPDEDETIKWRYRCPRCESTNWSPTNNHWYCHRCARELAHSDEATPEFYELVDMKTGERLRREDVRIEGRLSPGH